MPCFTSYLGVTVEQRTTLDHSFYHLQNGQKTKHRFWNASIGTQAAFFFFLNTRDQLNYILLLSPRPSNSWVLAHPPINWAFITLETSQEHNVCCRTKHCVSAVCSIASPVSHATHKQGLACPEAAQPVGSPTKALTPRQTRAGEQQCHCGTRHSLDWAVNLQDPRQCPQLSLATGTWKEQQSDRAHK